MNEDDFYQALPDSVKRWLDEKFSPEEQTLFQAGDTVRATINLPLIPKGATGVITELNHPMSADSQKGRPYTVKFDVSEFNIYPPEIPLNLRGVYADGEGYMSPLGTVTTSVSGLHLALIECGLSENRQDLYGSED